jgi:hypothetical protein
MREFVQLVTVLVDVAGGFERASEWVESIRGAGVRALDEVGLTTDTRIVLDRELHKLGLVDEAGRPVESRIAELALVLDVLAAVPPPRKREARSEPLVFTVPPEVSHLLAPAEHLEMLVADVIRSATSRIHIGGPFWNAEGLALLRTVLQPALEVRHVQCDFYAVRHGPEWDGVIVDFVRELATLGATRLWWYTGQAGSVMHAKFCVADEAVGYFGSANLTSRGLGQHVEIGVKLSAPQCAELLRLLRGLTEAGMFRAARLIGDIET